MQVRTCSLILKPVTLFHLGTSDTVVELQKAADQLESLPPAPNEIENIAEGRYK